VPVFLVRAFHHGAILANTKSGIRSPKDLEGKRVGVNRGYTVTTGVWARGILQSEYGVDLSKITWVLSGDEHVAEYRQPANVVPIEAGKKMGDMLAAGELAAAIGVGWTPNRRHSRCLRDRGGGRAGAALPHQPRCDQERASPPIRACRRRLRRLAASKNFISNAQAGRREADRGRRSAKRVMQITGDPLPHGIAPNRAVIEEGHTLKQGIITSPVTVEELFVPSTRGLTG
jgi:4,5-dihydroxyphthalate decarboxylase